LKGLSSTSDLDSNFKRGIGTYSPRAHQLTSPREPGDSAERHHFDIFATTGWAPSLLSDRNHLGRDSTSPRDGHTPRRLDLDFDSKANMVRVESAPVLLGAAKKQYVPPGETSGKQKALDAAQPVVMLSAGEYEDLIVDAVDCAEPVHTTRKKPPSCVRPLKLSSSLRHFDNNSPRNGTPRSERTPRAAGERTPRKLAGDVLARFRSNSFSSASTSCGADTPRDVTRAELQVFGQTGARRQPWNSATSLAKPSEGRRTAHVQVPAGVTSAPSRCKTLSTPLKTATRTYPSLAQTVPSKPRRQSRPSQEAPEEKRLERLREPPYFSANQGPRRTSGAEEQLVSSYADPSRRLDSYQHEACTRSAGCLSKQISCASTAASSTLLFH